MSTPAYCGADIASDTSFASWVCSWISAIVASTLSIVLSSVYVSLHIVHCEYERGETHSFPWISLSALDAFFIAAIVSALKLALSSVFICISSWNRVACSLSSSISFAFFDFNATVATDFHVLAH